MIFPGYADSQVWLTNAPKAAWNASLARVSRYFSLVGRIMGGFFLGRLSSWSGFSRLGFLCLSLVSSRLEVISSTSQQESSPFPVGDIVQRGQVPR